MNLMKNRQQISFLLRLWRMDETERVDWHASLEVPGSGRRIGFASLEQLFAYLMDLCDEKRDIGGMEEKN